MISLVELFYATITVIYSALIQFHSDGGFNQDLGRHLKLGELIVNTRSVPLTNLFTFTYPNFQFVNHHWFSEVIFYLTNSISGSMGLILIRLLLFLLLGIILWACAKKTTNRRYWFYLFQIILLPIFLDRQDLRPELFGYVFFAYFVFLLIEKRPIQYLYILPGIMLLWVNMHITFVFGYLLLGLVLISYGKRSVSVILFTLSAVLLNPRGLYGAIFPFLIFKDYGYQIAENQNLFFHLSNNIHLKYLVLLSPALLLTAIALLWKKRMLLLLLFITFYGLALVQIRHLPFFVIVAMVCCPLAFYELEQKIISRYKYITAFFSQIGLFLVVSIFFFFLMINYYGNIEEQNQFLQLGFQVDYQPAVDFLIQKKLSKNIFNNFDIGGYLDYRLYPKYQIFVDNRPDAFPGSFFAKTYIPVQQDEVAWSKMVKEHGIKTVIFAHSDQTPWAQVFLQRIIHDSNWKIVYLDGIVIILTRDDNLRDIRQDDNSFNTIIRKENNTRRLLYLSRMLTYLGSNQLAFSAIKKAHELRPESCGVNRALFSIYDSQNTVYTKAQAINIRSDYWYCF